MKRPHNTPYGTQNKEAGNLGEVFAKRLKQLGIKKQIDAALVCAAFDKAVMEVFGEDGTKNVRAISFRDNVLKVGVTSSAWANEVSLKQIELKGQKQVRIVYEQRDNNA